MPLKIGSLEKESTVYEEGLYIMGMGPFLGVLVVPVLPKRARLDHVVLTVPSPPLNPCFMEWLSMRRKQTSPEPPRRR